MTTREYERLSALWFATATGCRQVVAQLADRPMSDIVEFVARLTHDYPRALGQHGISDKGAQLVRMFRRRERSQP